MYNYAAANYGMQGYARAHGITALHLKLINYGTRAHIKAITYQLHKCRCSEQHTARM
jgi:hypothetical protein